MKLIVPALALALTGCAELRQLEGMMDKIEIRIVTREENKYEEPRIEIEDAKPTPVPTPLPAPIEVDEDEYQEEAETEPEVKSMSSGPYKCTSFREPRDGHKTGFILLQSHTKHVAKVIFPPDLQSRFSRVALLHKKRGDEKHSVVEKYRFDAMANPDRGRLRQHWIGSKPTSKLPDNGILYADGLCFKLGKMSERID